MTSCEETNPLDDNKTEQGGNENNGNEGGNENNGNGNEGGENTGGEENGDKDPATLTLSKVTATTATFSGHLDVPSSDLSFSKVTVYYSDAETFNVNNASYRSTTSFDGDQNFSINISELKSNTQYNYCVVTEVKSEKTYGEIKNFTTTEIGVPVVLPSNTPDKILALSPSLRCVVNFDCPGLRLSRKIWISSSERGRPEGHPSTTTPTALPWDSPHVVILNRLPMLDPNM